MEEYMTDKRQEANNEFDKEEFFEKLKDQLQGDKEMSEEQMLEKIDELPEDIDIEEIADDQLIDDLDEEDPQEDFAEDIENSSQDDDLTEDLDEKFADGVETDDRMDFEPTLESVTEAVLFASDEPLTAARLVSIVESGSVKQIRECVENLNEKYKESHSAFRIEQIAGGYQMMTLNAFNHWLKKLVRVRTDTKLSPAALETLAIISYKQPVIRADVEAIRGVASGEMIRSLMYKGLVKITGRAEVIGRPMLYGTTKKFLDIFGLNTLKDLPKIEELKKPTE